MSGKYIESYVTSQRPQHYNSEKSRVFDLIPEQQKQNADVLIKNFPHHTAIYCY